MKEIDENGDGEIDFEEFKAYIKSKSKNKRLKRNSKSSADNAVKHSRSDEKAQSSKTLTKDGNDDKLLQLWNVMDTDGSGHLTMEELKQGFEKSGIKMNEDQVQRLAKHIDTDKSGVIDFEEFKAYIKSKSKNKRKNRGRKH